MTVYRCILRDIHRILENSAQEKRSTDEPIRLCAQCYLHSEYGIFRGDHHPGRVFPDSESYSPSTITILDDSMTPNTHERRLADFVSQLYLDGKTTPGKTFEELFNAINVIYTCIDVISQATLVGVLRHMIRFLTHVFK